MNEVLRYILFTATALTVAAWGLVEAAMWAAGSGII